jgi:hypothetical protein
MIDQITLTNTPRGWIAEFKGPHSQEVIHLFGTNMLPTPFTKEASPKTVRECVQAQNPKVMVTLAEERTDSQC